MMELGRSWLLYGALILLRVFAAPFLPGYVHPDEFFQGGQELWFGCPPAIPWEFESQHALRSVMPPTVMTWLPLKFYAILRRIDVSNLSGLEVLVIPRIFCGLFSVLTVDASIWYLTYSPGKKDVPPELFLVASAWPTWVMLSRPFTNALETMWLALLMAITIRPTCRPTLNNIAVGVLCALGVWTRFTFVFVAVPTVLRYLLDKALDRASLREVSLLDMGFFGTAAAILYADIMYYAESSDWISRVTPLNALLYNSKVENLQDHGLHPRWTHAIVNMMLLYGPMTLLFYPLLPRRLASFFMKSKSNNVPRQEMRLQSTCLLTILSGLGFLSMAPHQEPRFLLPLLVPLVILTKICWQSRWIRFVWILFNAILFVVYGVLHQEGVVMSLLAQERLDGIEPRAVLYYHTYMPPTFLARKIASEQSCKNAAQGSDSCAANAACPNFPFIDLKGSPGNELLSSLDKLLVCSDSNDQETDEYAYVVAPPMTSEEVVLGSDCALGAMYSCRRLLSHRPHLTTEDFPPFDGSVVNLLTNMELSVYKVSCI